MNIIEAIAKDQAETDEKIKAEGWFTVTQTAEGMGCCRAKAKKLLEAKFKSGEAERENIIIGNSRTMVYRLKNETV